MNAEMFKENALVRIFVPGIMGNSRKVKITDKMITEAVGELPETATDAERKAATDAARERLSASKRLIVCKTFKDASSALSAAKGELVRRFCNPSYIDEGWFLVRLDRVEAFRAAMERLNQEIVRPAIDAFVAEYPAQIEAARRALGNSFDESQYPTQEKIASHPGIKYGLVQFSVPSGLPPEIREEEERKLRARFEAAQSEITAALWAEFQGLIDHLKERLEPGENGKVKTFQKTTVDNLKVFVEAFGNRNAFGDEKLSSLVARAGEIIGNIGDDPVAKLRDFDAVRKNVADAFGVLKVSVDKGVQDLPSRAFNADED